MPNSEHRLQRSVRVAGTGVALAALLACDGLLAPEPVVRPELEMLWVTSLGTVLADGGILDIRAVPADTSFRLHPDQRVPVDVAASSGDRETPGMYRLFCPPREHFRHNCFAFGFWMEEGAHALDLADEVARIGGRYRLVSVSGWFASITVFSPEDLIDHARAARSWPGVAGTQLSIGECQSWSPPWCPSPSRLAIPVPLDRGPPAPGDGVLQFAPGDTLTISYPQPGGGALSWTVAMP